MDALYTLAYPRLAVADRKFIDAFRREHDIPFRDVVAPHFTLIFSCSDVPLDEYRDHVSGVVREQSEIEFVCRCAQVVKDSSSGNYYIFLVPDEGYSELSRLHDALYRGPFASHLRLDIPYIPHIGVATMTDAARIKVLCDELNLKQILIRGMIDALTICSYDGVKITDVETFACRT